MYQQEADEQAARVQDYRSSGKEDWEVRKQVRGAPDQ